MVSTILQCPQYVLHWLLRNTTTTVNPKEFLPHFSRSATQRPRQHAPSSGQGCSSLHAVVNGRCTQKINIRHRRQCSIHTSCHWGKPIDIVWYANNVGKHVHEILEENRFNPSYRATSETMAFGAGIRTCVEISQTARTGYRSTKHGFWTRIDSTYDVWNHKMLVV